MTILEQIAQILPTLSADEQHQVLDVAQRLRSAHQLPDITVPSSDSDDAAWDAWSERVGARSEIVMALETRRMQALGILDEHGNVMTDAIPDDMRPTSQTSVET
jgi:hypothetical protein